MLLPLCLLDGGLFCMPPTPTPTPTPAPKPTSPGFSCKPPIPTPTSEILMLTPRCCSCCSCCSCCCTSCMMLLLLEWATANRSPCTRRRGASLQHVMLRTYLCHAAHIYFYCIYVMAHVLLHVHMFIAYKLMQHVMLHTYMSCCTHMCMSRCTHINVMLHTHVYVMLHTYMIHASKTTTQQFYACSTLLSAP